MTVIKQAGFFKNTSRKFEADASSAARKKHKRRKECMFTVSPTGIPAQATEGRIQGMSPGGGEGGGGAT